jgi:hypothetical protein
MDASLPADLDSLTVAAMAAACVTHEARVAFVTRVMAHADGSLFVSTIAEVLPVIEPAVLTLLVEASSEALGHVATRHDLTPEVVDLLATAAIDEICLRAHDTRITSPAAGLEALSALVRQGRFAATHSGLARLVAQADCERRSARQKNSRRWAAFAALRHMPDLPASVVAALTATTHLTEGYERGRRRYVATHPSSGPAIWQGFATDGAQDIVEVLARHAPVWHDPATVAAIGARGWTDVPTVLADWMRVCPSARRREALLRILNHAPSTTPTAVAHLGPDAVGLLEVSELEAVLVHPDAAVRLAGIAALAAVHADDRSAPTVQADHAPIRQD